MGTRDYYCVAMVPYTGPLRPIHEVIMENTGRMWMEAISKLEVRWFFEENQFIPVRYPEERMNDKEREEQLKNETTMDRLRYDFRMEEIDATAVAVCMLVDELKALREEEGTKGLAQLIHEYRGMVEGVVSNPVLARGLARHILDQLSPGAQELAQACEQNRRNENSRVEQLKAIIAGIADPGPSILKPPPPDWTKLWAIASMAAGADNPPATILVHPDTADRVFVEWPNGREMYQWMDGARPGWEKVEGF